MIEEEEERRRRPKTGRVWRGLRKKGFNSSRAGDQRALVLVGVGVVGVGVVDCGYWCGGCRLLVVVGVDLGRRN